MCGLAYDRHMPTVLRSGPYRFFFFSGDRDEPPHIHAERESNTAKFWLQPTRLARSSGFSRTELRRIETLVRDGQEGMLRAWNEFFSD